MSQVSEDETLIPEPLGHEQEVDRVSSPLKRKRNEEEETEENGTDVETKKMAKKKQKKAIKKDGGISVIVVGGETLKKKIEDGVIRAKEIEEKKKQKQQDNIDLNDEKQDVRRLKCEEAPLETLGVYPSQNKKTGQSTPAEASLKERIESGLLRAQVLVQDGDGKHDENKNKQSEKEMTEKHQDEKETKNDDEKDKKEEDLDMKRIPPLRRIFVTISSQIETAYKSGDIQKLDVALAQLENAAQREYKNDREIPMLTAAIYTIVKKFDLALPWAKKGTEQDLVYAPKFIAIALQSRSCSLEDFTMALTAYKDYLLSPGVCYDDSLMTSIILALDFGPYHNAKLLYEWEHIQTTTKKYLKPKPVTNSLVDFLRELL